MSPNRYILWNDRGIVSCSFACRSMSVGTGLGSTSVVPIVDRTAEHPLAWAPAFSAIAEQSQVSKYV